MLFFWFYLCFRATHDSTKDFPLALFSGIPSSSVQENKFDQSIEYESACYTIID